MTPVTEDDLRALTDLVAKAAHAGSILRLKIRTCLRKDHAMSAQLFVTYDPVD